ncbi:MAG: hypothetical protein CO090_06805 [Acidobacteria bacterium CG_4_9_14_3_um_filter_49_7]|nr:MAG: hypothetical protein CO090_06805 [Acidobacteria bacterium CG_4_9_14_3_um_filter_49_7]
MKAARRQKIIRSSIGALVAIFLFFSPGLRLPVLDSTTDGYFREALTKAAVTYATCRIINASVSIVKDSSVNLEPAGVGVTLAVGQVLDPIDDMAERVSDVVVTAITSLGVQKLAYEIGVSLAPPILAIFLLILSVLIWFENEELATLQKTIIRFILLLLIARFALPISALTNNYIQKNFFEGQITSAYKELAVGSAALDKLTKISLPESDGMLGTLKNNASFIQRKSVEFKDAIITTVHNAGNIIENLLKIIFLYVGVILIQVIALPILVFWLLVKLANNLFDTNAPVIISSTKRNNDW